MSRSVGKLTARTSHTPASASDLSKETDEDGSALFPPRSPWVSSIDAIEVRMI